MRLNAYFRCAVFLTAVLAAIPVCHAQSTFTISGGLTGYQFNPPSQTFTDLESNETATFAAYAVYTISGQVTVSGTGLAGVAVTMSGAQTSTVYTDASGNYTLPAARSGLNYKVQPALSGYIFSPPSQTFSDLSGNETANFSAEPLYRISGRVTASGAGVSGVTMTLSGSQSASATTNSSGSYSFRVVAGGTYTISPSWGYQVFAPPSQTLADVSANQTVDFQEPPLTVLYNFQGPPDGANPSSNLVEGADHVLYGTTGNGGVYGGGTVFSLTPPSSPGGSWTEAVLHSFQGFPDGAGPTAGVVVGSGGVLYGTTSGGGSTTCGDPGGCGIVFSLTPPSAPGGTWTETVLYSFQGAATGDGANPYGGVVMGKGGILYGATMAGGNSGFSAGTVFSLKPPASAGGTWTESLLHTFSGSFANCDPTDTAACDGIDPQAIVIGADEVIYGVTNTGGAYENDSCGTLFSLTPPSQSGQTWTYGLFSFGLNYFEIQPGDYIPDACNPGAISLSNGLLYVTASSGQDATNHVVSVTPGTWNETLIAYQDPFNQISGPVSVTSGGEVYGTSSLDDVLPPGATVNAGFVYSVSPGLPVAVLHYFTGYPNDGSAPKGGVLIESSGAMYGVTSYGGNGQCPSSSAQLQGCGTVYVVQP